MAERKYKRELHSPGSAPFAEGRPLPALPTPGRAAGAAAEKLVAKERPDTVQKTPYTDNMNLRQSILQVLEQQAPHVSAARRSAVADWVAAACDPDRPMKWALKPEGESFETYLAREYRDRGYVAAGLTAADVSRYDKQFSEIYRTNAKRGNVPDDCRLAKGDASPSVSEERRAAIARLARPAPTVR